MTNVALHKKVTSSATNASPEDLAKITDGEKEAAEENIGLAPPRQPMGAN